MDDKILFTSTKTNIGTFERIKWGEHELSPKQLALIAENMRTTLIELGYEVKLDKNILK